MKITKNQLRRIIREEKNRLLVEAPTGKDLLGEFQAIRNRLLELTNILEFGNAETPEMGGLDVEAQSVMASYTEDAAGVMDSMIDELEQMIENGGVY